MATAKRKVVLAALVILPTPNGIVYVYKDGYVPEDADPAAVERLEGLGMIGDEGATADDGGDDGKKDGGK